MSAAEIPKVRRSETVSSHQTINTLKGLVYRNTKLFKKTYSKLHFILLPCCFFCTNQSQRSIFLNRLTHQNSAFSKVHGSRHKTIIFKLVEPEIMTSRSQVEHSKISKWV